MAEPLKPPVESALRTVDGPVGRLAYQHSSSTEGTPLVLIHSINAAASSFEMLPIYRAFEALRPVYLLDLPGFGLSDRPAIRYQRRMYVEAIQAMVSEVRKVHGGPVDAFALSLSSEFLARAVVEAPKDFARVGFINPTGFSRGSSALRTSGATKEVPGFAFIFEDRPWSKPLFDLLTTRGSIGYFLRRTFGSRNVQPELIEQAYATAHQPGAHHAPFAFLSGRLFSRDIRLLYEGLGVPLWVPHGTRGDFKDFSETAWAEARTNWRFDAFASGALPHWECETEFNSLATQFLEGA